MRSLPLLLALLLTPVLGLLPSEEVSAPPEPLYLGRSTPPETVVLGASGSWAALYPLWPLGPDTSTGFRPVVDPVDAGLYHVPSIVDFLSPDYRPEGMNYTYHVPALGEFIQDGSQSKDYHLYHVPAIASFLEEGWSPPAPEYDSYPAWIQAYLNGQSTKIW